MVVVTVRGVSYYMNPKLKSTWDKLKDGYLTKRDEDRAYVVDGRERVGKSLFAIQQASYIDETILDDGPNGELLPRITFSQEETLKAIRETKSTPNQTKCIIYDEAFRGLSSKSALSKVNKSLVSALQEMGQNNLVLFIVTPSFFLLELYPAVLRTTALFHIVKSKKNNIRSFRCFNEKKKNTLYQVGVRKGWGYYVKTKLKDNFYNKYPGGDDFEQRYRKKKLMAIRDSEPEQVGRKHKWLEQRDNLIKILHFKAKWKQVEIVRALTEEGTPITHEQVTQIISKATANTE